MPCPEERTLYLCRRLCCRCNCNNHFYKLKPNCDSAEFVHGSILLIYSTTEPDLKFALFMMKSCKRNSWGDFLLQVPSCTRAAQDGEYPPSKPGSLISPDHVTLRLGFPKGYQVTGPTSFLVGWFCWEILVGAAAEHLELRVFHKHSLSGSRAWRIDRVSLVILGLHTESSWPLLLCLYRKSSCGSKSWL